MKKILSAIFLIVVGFASVSCSTAHHAAQDTAKLQCAASFSTWYYHKGGKQEIHTLDQEVTPMLKAAKAHKHGEVKNDAATVEKADTQLQNNLPPDCVPNLDTDLKTLLQEINTDAQAAVADNLPKVQSDSKIVYTDSRIVANDLVSYAHGGK